MNPDSGLLIEIISSKNTINVLLFSPGWIFSLTNIPESVTCMNLMASS
jgi:hypothetical protein